MHMRKRGRPAKNGLKDSRALSRVLAVLHSYDQARAEGEKYSVAIDEAIAFVRQLHPTMRISQTEAKRVLGEFRPKGACVILKSEFSVAEGEEARKIRSKMSERGFLPISPVESTEIEEEPRPVKRFKLRFAEAPHYPRHNAKNSQS
jgi:hypothetical protein